MKKMYVKIFIFSVLILTGCQKYVNEDKTYNNIQNEIKTDDITSKYASLPEIRESKEEVMEQAYNGKWNNLHFEQFDPYISDENEIFKITWKDSSYNDLTEIEIFKEQIRIIECFSNDFPNGDFTWEDKTYGFKNDWSYDDVNEVISRGKIPYELKYNHVSYADPREKEFYLKNSISTNMSFSWLRVNHRKITNTALEPMIEDGSYQGQGVPGINEWFLETEKIYLSNMADGSLNDEWQLLDGKMSVKECIEFVEEYLNSQMPFETNPNIKAKVFLVRVLKVKEGVYAYSCMIGREIYGILTEVFPSSYGYSQEGIVEDGGLAEIIEHGVMDSFECVPLTIETEKQGEAITEIISLENIFNKLSNRIGENSSYKILSVELGYRLTERTNDYAYYYGEGTPIWRIIATNENDNKNYVFEIDCVTGQIRSREKKLY